MEAKFKKNDTKLTNRFLKLKGYGGWQLGFYPNGKSYYLDTITNSISLNSPDKIKKDDDYRIMSSPPNNRFKVDYAETKKYPGIQVRRFLLPNNTFGEPKYFDLTSKEHIGKPSLENRLEGLRSWVQKNMNIIFWVKKTGGFQKAKTKRRKRLRRKRNTKNKKSFN